ncbi:MAG: urease accessory UreF family protein [Methylacidiphilaceae bacterium]|nr:urease accessory UreF family protein [Candidatus Methylacidiphilaceae bacterium]
MGEVDSVADLEAQLRRTFIPMVLRVDVPLLVRARRAAKDQSWSSLQEIDRLSAALRWSSEQREAASRMGARRLRLLKRVLHPPAIQEHFAFLAGSLPYTQACVVAGAEAALLAIPAKASAIAFGYQAMAGIVLAAVKLLRIGPFEGQKLLQQSVAEILAGLDRVLDFREEEIGWFAPSLDIASARHARANERQFLT